jgi:hypothetical protein
MVNVQRTKRVAAGDWQTLESGWNATFDCQFVAPVGAQVKIRYGTGWIFGRDSQRQTLDGINTKTLHVGLGSVAYARVQMKLQRDAHDHRSQEVTYVYVPI